MNTLNLIKKSVPSGLQSLIRPFWLRFKEAKFRRQGTIRFKVGSHELELPANHPLPDLTLQQPFRDRNITVIARSISDKYPAQSIIDIGANVGDTAALIRSCSPNPLILVEASDYYFPILKRNAATLPGEISLEQSFVADGNTVSGQLNHWGGTASFQEGGSASTIPTKNLADLTPRKVCFLKTDTDGFDFRILLAGMPWIRDQRPVILLESQIANVTEFALANELHRQLMEAGYLHFIVWDDVGLKLLSTSEISALQQLHRYLFLAHTTGSGTVISNFDIACFHSDDQDVFSKVAAYFDQLTSGEAIS